jgi:GH35 family endo-1,4-beta-xylanase
LRKNYKLFMCCRYCLSHDTICRGLYNPDYLTGKSTGQLITALLSHATTLVTAFNGSAGAPASYCFDAVNEAVSDDILNSSLIFKDNTWYPIVSDYVAQTFHAARRANPTVKLFYNDYGTLQFPWHLRSSL